VLLSGGHHPEGAVVDALKRGLRLVALPGEFVVSTTTSVARTSEAPTAEAVIKVTPRAALRDGWYALEVVDPPAEVTWAGHEQGGAAKVRSRFRVGAEPAVKEMWLCRGRGLKSYLRVEFSEDITGRTVEDASLELGTHTERQASCRVSPSVVRRTLELGACSGIDAADAVKLGFRLGYRGTGVSSPQRRAPRFRFEFRLSAATDNGTCWVIEDPVNLSRSG
jgi:hypothetical protein